MENLDVIIIGGGPAGLSAALYTARRALSTLVLTKDIGGQTSLTNDIENYPGVDFSTGPDLMKAFADQAKKFGARIEFDGVEGISKSSNAYTVATRSGKTYTARALIIATGKHPRKLDVPGEAEYANKGVVYCATCDAPLFGGKTVVVVGGGSAAFDAAILLSKIGAEKIYLVHRRDTFRAENILVERAKQDPKIEFIVNSTIEEITGGMFVEGVRLKGSQDDQTLAVGGVFVEVGQVVDTSYLGGLLELNEAGEIIINELNQTSEHGIFAAGDVTTVPFKQTVICAGEGAIAALAAYEHLQGLGPIHGLAE